MFRVPQVVSCLRDGDCAFSSGLSSGEVTDPLCTLRRITDDPFAASGETWSTYARTVYLQPIAPALGINPAEACICMHASLLFEFTGF